MKTRFNRKCILCKQDYSYCTSCRDDANKPTWMKLYCSENCKNIFTALNDFNFKLIDKDQAKERLSKCNTSIKLNEHYRNEINTIMREDKKLEQPIKPQQKDKVVSE